MQQNILHCHQNGVITIGEKKAKCLYISENECSRLFVGNINTYIRTCVGIHKFYLHTYLHIFIIIPVYIFILRNNINPILFYHI